MHADIRHEIQAKLVNDFHFKERNDWFRSGTCPQCNKKELYAHAKNTWHIKCGRENNCGWNADIKELYPEIFEGFNKRYQPTNDNPNTTADAYMEFCRGFPIKEIKGWYRQDKYWNPKANKGTATVLFDIDREKGLYMERFVETIYITDEGGTQKPRKQNFQGAFRGLWWQPPGFKIEKGDKLYLVEAIIDAISLNLEGHKAVATLSCTNYPKILLESLPSGIELFWGLDNDVAGRKYTKKFHKQAEEAGFNSSAILIPSKGKKKLDWNDAYQKGMIDDAKMNKYRHHGALLIAPTPFEKALLIWGRYAKNNFAVEFGNKIYWFALDLEKFGKQLDSLRGEKDAEENELRLMAAKLSHSLTEISNCNFQFLYFQENKKTDESWYYAKIDFPHGRHTLKNTFTGGQVASSSEFKKRLLSIAPGALFSGKGFQLDWIIKNYLDDIKIVDTVDFIGYSKEHKAYVFNDLCVAEGRAYEINDEDFFEVGKLSLKSLNKSTILQIGGPSDYNSDWTQYVWDAYGVKGLVAATFFFGSLFADQIRKRDKSFPFMEIVGSAGSGKTTLIEFLWKLMGRDDYEGFDPNKSTLAARARIMSQVANLPISLIESDREDSSKARQFDWDELKTAYNGRSPRSRGVKNSGNDTDEPPFRGTILISQNAQVEASEAIMQRIVHMSFTTDDHTSISKVAADKLAAMQVEDVSYFIRLAVQSEQKILSKYADRVAGYEARLSELPEIKSVRIAKNHAQFMALADAMAEMINLPKEQHAELIQCLKEAAIIRQTAIGADHPVVAEFWDAFDYMSDFQVLDHSKDPQLIAINIPHVLKVAHDCHQPLPATVDLKRHLKSSSSRKFRGIKAVNSCITDKHDVTTKTMKCWIFDAGAA